MDMVKLKASARAQDAKAAAIRRSGFVPCILYGNNAESATLQCSRSDLFRAYASAGESTLVELEVDGRKVPVLFHALEVDPVSDAITHVDFFAVDMKKEIEARVPLHCVGEAPAVKDLGGILVHVHDHVTVRCLPVRLPRVIDVSLGSLAAFGDSVSVADLQVPEGVRVLEEADAVVATVQQPREEEVEEKPAEEGETAEGEAAEGEVKEGEEGAKKEETEKKEKAEKEGKEKKEG